LRFACHTGCHWTLLNEFLKEHQKVQRLEAALAAVNERIEGAGREDRQSERESRIEQSCVAPNSGSISQSAVTLHRVAAFVLLRSRLFEIARLLVRLNHVACFIVNANHSVVAAGPRKFSISSPVDEMSR